MFCLGKERSLRLPEVDLTKGEALLRKAYSRCCEFLSHLQASKYPECIQNLLGVSPVETHARLDVAFLRATSGCHLESHLTRLSCIFHRATVCFFETDYRRASWLAEM